MYSNGKHEQRHFQQHNEDITCMAKHPGRKLMATGQINPKGAEAAFVQVWDSTKAEPKLIAHLGSHHDSSISAVAFSFDGAVLISIDDSSDHCCAIWDWKVPYPPPVAHLTR
jgi:WD40 repeat protein